MTPFHWLLWGILAAAAFAAAFFLYRLREPAGRGRGLLAGLRGGAIALLLLLLFDPVLPLGGSAGDGTVVLLDASLSMATSPDADDSPWAASLAALDSVGAGDVLLFGSAVRRVDRDSLDALRPSDPATRLAPAVRAAVEAGAAGALVVTDGRIEDVAEARRIARAAGLVLEWRRPAPTGPDRAIVAVDAPEWAEAGEPVQVRVEVGAQGVPPGDSIHIVVRGDAGVITRSSVAAPAAGRIAVAELAFEPEPSAGAGPTRYDVAIEGSDARAANDERTFYVRVEDEPAGVALVSLTPDWEPRFLQPVLADALGLPTRGYLRVADGRWLRTGGALEAASDVPAATVRAAAARATLLVLHGLGADAPAWAAELARTAPRLLILPASGPGAEALPVRLPPATPGDWYVAPELPASPVAPFLTGVATDSLRPLPELRVVPRPVDAWTPLAVRRARSGEAVPALLGGSRDGRRWVVALGSGYWRWAFQGGTSRAAYRALWSALAGWLVGDVRGPGAVAVRPARWSTPRGERVAWIAPGVAFDSVHVALRDSAGVAAIDTVVPVVADTAWLAAPPPGHYAYEASALNGDGEVARSEATLTVDRWSPDIVRPVVAGGAQDAAGAPADPGVGAGATGENAGAAAAGQLMAAAGQPLRTSPWPYVVILSLLCVEWTLRRRWGLR